jgi:hypothetical protein
VLFGGKHFVYVFRHSPDALDASPAYDQGRWLMTMFNFNGNPANTPIVQMSFIYRSIMWTGIPMAVADQPWLHNDATVKLRVSVPYQMGRWSGDAVAGTYQGPNAGLPSYAFTTKDIATSKVNQSVAESALDLINIVPNPYYAYSDYETSQLDNRVKIVNLPDNCVVKIYSINGTLVRTFSKDNNLTYLEWDLKNQASIPISSGVYLIHVNAPGIGEKVIKWFGAMRPIDLNAF